MSRKKNDEFSFMSNIQETSQMVTFEKKKDFFLYVVIPCINLKKKFRILIRPSTYVCCRGKSLLESWGTTFLPD